MHLQAGQAATSFLEYYLGVAAVLSGYKGTTTIKFNSAMSCSNVLILVQI